MTVCEHPPDRIIKVAAEDGEINVENMIFEGATLKYEGLTDVSGVEFQCCKVCGACRLWTGREAEGENPWTLWQLPEMVHK